MDGHNAPVSLPGPRQKHLGCVRDCWLQSDDLPMRPRFVVKHVKSSVEADLVVLWLQATKDCTQYTHSSS